MATRLKHPTNLLFWRRLSILSALPLDKDYISEVVLAMEKKTRALTTEEYVARASLLGFSVYDDITHTYWRADDDVELDADTLEPVDKEERNKRYLEYAEENGYESGGFYGGEQATKPST